MARKLISSGSPIIGFSRAVRVGQYIVVCGTAPLGRDGKIVAIGDPEAQVRPCVEIAKAALQSCLMR